MSRCFPFPPPGYDKKHRPAEDLLREEKHREKKHKKEKKEKEKREGKDKKERDKSDGKRKEKKDRKEKDRDKKEKHRDKKKDKEKDRSKDKEKSSISEDASIAGQPETRSVERVHTRQEGFKDRSHSSDDKNFTLQARGQNGQNLVDNRLFAKENEESKFVEELGRRIRDEGKAMESLPVGSFLGAYSKVQEETGKFAVRSTQNLADDTERNREGKVDNKNMGGQGLSVGSRFSGNTLVQNLAAVAEPKLEGISGRVQKDGGRSTEGRDTSTNRDDDRSREKGKIEDKDKKSHGKDKGREKEKKKDEKTKEKTKIRRSDQDRSKELYRNGVTDSNNSPYLLADLHKNLTVVEISKKRKDVETNGFLYENEVRPNKLQRFTFPNGRIPEACHTSISDAADKHGVASNFTVDHKESRVNGSIEAPLLFASKQKSESATRSDQPVEVIPRPPPPPLSSPTDPDEASKKVAEASKNHRRANQMAEPSRKPPHPDLKYLSQVLTVPTMDSWSEVDDQEWLSSSKDPALKESKECSSSDKEPVVWSEALLIESADVYALPYVIPY